MSSFLERTTNSLSSYKDVLDSTIKDCKTMGIISNKKLTAKYKDYTAFVESAIDLYKKSKHAIYNNYTSCDINWFYNMSGSLYYALNKCIDISVQLSRQPDWRTRRFEQSNLEISNLIFSLYNTLETIQEDLLVTYAAEFAEAPTTTAKYRTFPKESRSQAFYRTFYYMNEQKQKNNEIDEFNDNYDDDADYKY